MGVAANLVFLPWVRQGAAAAIATDDKIEASDLLPGSATLTATVTVNTDHTVTTPVRLYGPSDIAGVNTRVVVRREPPPNTASFEDNHFAAIEFDRPDFPWLFTPARAAASARLRPWLCLVVVREQDGVSVAPGSDTSLARIDIVAPAQPALELPDLAESWLWVHAQVAGNETIDADALRARITDDPDLSLSRLICPRQLLPDTRYIACLVPTFEPGRLSGLGLPSDSGAVLAPAWTAASIKVTLPLYDHWTFSTGSGGDFKTLVMKLHAQRAPPGLGKRPIGISTPGLALPASFPAAATVDLEGALLPLDAESPTWPPDTEAPFKAALAPILNFAVTDPDADPLLKPPLYGRWHAARDAALTAGTTWFDELNLDPRQRVVAAFGTRVIQQHQEDLMASAWQQAGDLKAANLRLRQMQLGLFVGTSLHVRHLARMQSDAVLRVAAPALGRLRAVPVAGDTRARTMVSAFAGARLPLASVMPAMRRLSRERGPIGRRLDRVADASSLTHATLSPGTSTSVVTSGGTSTSVGPGAAGGTNVGGSVVARARGLTGVLVQLNEAVVVSTGPTPGMATFNQMRMVPSLASTLRYAGVNHDAVAAMPGAPQYQLVPEGTRIRMPVANTAVTLVDNPVAAAFRSAAEAHLAALNPARPWISIFVLPQPMLLDQVRAQVQAQLQPMTAMVSLVQAVVNVAGPATAPASSADTTTDPTNQMMFAPHFPQPMYEALRDLSQDLLLPGLDKVLPDSVVGLRTNDRFVDAYLVGLNVEMGRELLWRGFPTDQRGTYFDRFWDMAGSGAPPDVKPLHEWGDAALDAGGAQTSGRFVVLLRSELLLRYPTASIYAVPAKIVSGRRVPSDNADEEIHPAFRGSLPPDVTFIGFDLTRDQILAGDGFFIVIQEQPSAPRFGVDGGTAGGYLQTVPGPPSGLSLRGLQWRLNGAHMAGIVRRQPVRIAIHASKFITAAASAPAPAPV